MWNQYIIIGTAVGRHLIPFTGQVHMSKDLFKVMAELRFIVNGASVICVSFTNVLTNMDLSPLVQYEYILMRVKPFSREIKKNICKGRCPPNLTYLHPSLASHSVYYVYMIGLRSKQDISNVLNLLSLSLVYLLILKP